MSLGRLVEAVTGATFTVISVCHTQGAPQRIAEHACDYVNVDKRNHLLSPHLFQQWIKLLATHVYCVRLY